jgi:polar amino acid transport system substrate-binding protein
VRRALVAAAAVTVAVGAAASANAQPAVPLTLPTLTPGTLTVGLDMPSQGFQTGAVIGSEVTFAQGFEIDLARSLAAAMGLRARFVQVPSFGTILAPGPKSFDVALAQVSINAARRRDVAFSVPYLTSGEGVLMRRGVTPVPTTVARLRTLRICVQRGTTGAALVRARVRPTRPAVQIADVTRLWQSLQTGRCDAVVYDSPTVAVLRQRAPLRFGPIAGVLGGTERYGAVMAKGSPLLPEVNTALLRLLRNGTVDRLAQRNLSVDLSALRVLR